jgi:hypothetical protein
MTTVSAAWSGSPQWEQQILGCRQAEQVLVRRVLGSAEAVSGTRLAPSIRWSEPLIHQLDQSFRSVANQYIAGCNREAMDDDELITRLAGGDNTALRELFSRHAPWLATRLRTVLPSSDVEDAHL